MSHYLKKRGKKFHFRRRVPTQIQFLFDKNLIQIPLDTDSESIALQRAQHFNVLLEDFWSDLLNMDKDEVSNAYEQLLFNSKVRRFQYIPKKELVEQTPLYEFINRVNMADSTQDMFAKELILGGLVSSEITLNKARDEYFSYEQGNLRELSENQIRKWKNPRKKAVRNFIEVIGNKPINEINRKDVLDFRQWWVDRIQNEDLASNSANKEFGIIRKILSVAKDNQSIELPVDALFKGVSLKKMEKIKRYSFSNEFIKGALLKPQGGLNIEAQMLIYAMADTGARISELTGLEAKDIILDSDIPHIKIRPNQTRILKTSQSERDIPLVGASLYAFQQLGGVFQRYQGKPDLISSTINKYFRENNILPSKHYSLYSLRHSFEDRLTAVEPPDKVQAALMGHKYVRPRYGSGPSLEQKRLWLDKIAFQIG